MYDAVKELLSEIPDFGGGIITITMSENFTRCNVRANTDYPICKMPPEKSQQKYMAKMVMQSIVP